MPAPIVGTVGPGLAQDGTNIPVRQGRLGDVIVSELHGRFYEQNYRGTVYGGGMLLTSISNATFTTATTGVTATPIIGVWNPAGSTVNLSIIYAMLGIGVTALTATGGGPYAWMYSLGNAAITTGSAPINKKTLLASGSQAKFFAGTALTGMTGTLAVLRGSALAGGSAAVSEVGTAVGFAPLVAGSSLELMEGTMLVPPGAVVGLFATTTPVAHSATSGIAWEEVPL